MPYGKGAIRSTCSGNVCCGSHEFHEIRDYRETGLGESRELHASPSREVTREEFALSAEHRLQMDRGWHEAPAKIVLERRVHPRSSLGIRAVDETLR